MKANQELERTTQLYLTAVFTNMHKFGRFANDGRGRFEDFVRDIERDNNGMNFFTKWHATERNELLNEPIWYSSFFQISFPTNSGRDVITRL